MAGLLGTAIAGALAGGGKAAQWNAQSAIEQKRQSALSQLEHGLAMERQNDQQTFTTSERKAKQDFTAEENSADRNLSRWQTNTQQAGANSRATMSAGEIVPLKEGGYGLLNTADGTLSELPEGVDYQGDGKLTERENALVRNLQARIEAIDEQVSGKGRFTMEPDQLEKLQSQREQYQEQLDGVLNYQAPEAKSSPQNSAPAAAVDYLRQNNSPAMRSAFREKFGYLPEGF